jgi:class 3 adenylate cyclase
VSVLPSGVVTFLLTDVVGSTRLWEASPATMTVALARHDELLREAVESNGGVLLKSKGEGDSTFSVFARASAAVAAASDAQRAIAREAWPETAAIRVRMAVHTGEVVERNGDYFGRTVNRAARLRALAGAAHVLLSQAPAEIVVDSLPEECLLADLGVQHLRDLDRPERVYRLVWADVQHARGIESMQFIETRDLSDGISSGGSVALPSPFAETQRTRFTGRMVERARLDRQFDLVAAGACRATLLGGEPGIGKTRLATSSALTSFQKGATVLLGRCDEDVAVPYGPWIEALTHLVRHVSGDVLGSILPRSLIGLSGLVPEISRRVPGLTPRVATDPETDRYLLFSAVVAMLGAASVEHPIVLVLDDLQWCDRPGLLLLRHVLQSSTPMRLQVLATFRDAEGEITLNLAEFLSVMHRDTVAERIAIGGLVESEIIEMVEGVVGHPLDTDGLALASMLCRDTDGNPFFAGELLRHLVESGVLAHSSDRGWSVSAALQTAGLPQSVRAVTSQRVARLGADAQRALRLAAVVGREFELDLLTAVSDTSEVELIDVLEQARDRSLVEEVGGAAGRYRFVHALIQRTLYDELGATRRRLLHRTIALSLERFRDGGAKIPAAELAQHWLSGAHSTDAERVIASARSAGDAAADALAPDEASRWYSSALAVLDKQAVPDPDVRTDLLIALGTTQNRHQSSLHDAARLAHARGDANGLIRAVLADSRGWRSRFGEVDRERLVLVEAAIDAAGTEDSSQRARLLKVYARDLAYVGDNQRCRLTYEKAIEIARRVGDAETLLHVLIRQFTGFWGPDSLDYRLAASREAVALADRLGDPVASFWAYADLSFVATSAAEGAELRRATERWMTLADELGPQPGLDWIFSAMRSSPALRAGRFIDAERHAYEAFDFATEVGQGRPAHQLSLQLCPIWNQRGDDGPVLSMLSEHVTADASLDAHRAMLVRALLNTGNREAALEFFQAEADRGFAAPWNTYWLVVTCLWAELSVRFEDRAAASLLYERLTPWHGQIALMFQTTDNSVSFYLAMIDSMLGKNEAANGYFAAALDAHERIGARHSISRTKLQWGRHLLPADACRASELISEALTEALYYGFARLEREAREALDALKALELSPVKDL